MVARGLLDWMSARSFTTHSNHRDLDGSGTMLHIRVATSQLDTFQNNIHWESCRNHLHASVTWRDTHEVQASEIHGWAAILPWIAKLNTTQRDSRFLSQACGRGTHTEPEEISHSIAAAVNIKHKPGKQSRLNNFAYFFSRNVHDLCQSRYTFATAWDLHDSWLLKTAVTHVTSPVLRQTTERVLSCSDCSASPQTEQRALEFGLCPLNPTQRNCRTWTLQWSVCKTHHHGKLCVSGLDL